MEVGRSLDQIDQKIKKLNSSIKESTSLTKELDKAIKLDSKNIDAVETKMKTLQNQIGLATQKVALLKQKQLEATKAFEKGDMTAKEFNKIEVAILKAENELKRYNVELERSTDAPKINRINNLSKGFDNVTNSLQKSQKMLKTFSAITIALVTSATALVTSFTKQTLALNEQAKALDVNIEKLQLQRNVYKEITGDANNYDSALSSLKNVLNSITLGQGNGYLNILKHIGVSTKDVEGNTKSLSEIYDEVIVALSNMENVSLRNSLAYELFGENAVNILEVMQTSIDTIDELNEKQLELGITTEEQAKTAEQIQEIWTELKMEFALVGAELAESLLPIIQIISQFILENVVPILKTIANWFTGMSPQQQKFTLFLLMIIILLPKIVAIITAIVGVIKAITIASYGAAGGIGAVSAASTPLLPILWAIAAVILIVATLFAFLTGQSTNLTNSLNQQTSQMAELESQYADLESEVDINTTQVSENSNKSSIDVNVDINAYGDSAISQENAELVADILAQRINKELGGKI